mmetsp:Transcript_18541/g.51563  ORF Transcript_18541/g.51563 Transcript_18541/m.51563 type:complete len:87 (+) Transcript_18541:436-696(+)
MASFAAAVAEKPTKDTPLGLDFRDRDGKVVVCSVERDGIFGSSELEPGMELISLNNIGVMGSNVDDVRRTMEASQGTIIVLAETKY